MKPSDLFHHALFVGLTVVAGSASAALSGSDTVSIDFVNMNANQPGAASAYYGKANIDASADQGCNTILTKCYFEDEFSIGSVIDPAAGGAHLHRYSKISDVVGSRSIQYHGDSAGIYVRANDLSAFSLNSFLADTRITADNPYANTDPNNYFEILGFSSALNPGLTNPDHDWVNDPTFGGERVAYQTFANIDSLNTITLNDDFKNISAFWIHYVGFPFTPRNGEEFGIQISAIQLSAPATVPVPAAVYLFGTGLMGFLALGKKRRAI